MYVVVILACQLGGSDRWGWGAWRAGSEGRQAPHQGAWGSPPEGQARHGPPGAWVPGTHERQIGSGHWDRHLQEAVGGRGEQVGSVKKVFLWYLHSQNFSINLWVLKNITKQICHILYSDWPAVDLQPPFMCSRPLEACHLVSKSSSLSLNQSTFFMTLFSRSCWICLWTFILLQVSLVVALDLAMAAVLAVVQDSEVVLDTVVVQDTVAAPSAKPVSPLSAAVDAIKEKPSNPTQPSVPPSLPATRSLQTFLQLKPSMVLYSSQTAIPY